MKTKVCYKTTFDAAHFLPTHKGKCRNLHGHTYTLIICLSGDKLNNKGMLIDFGDIKAVVNQRITSILDHSLLNDLHNIGFPFDCPTAERIAEWIASIIVDWIEKSINDKEIKLDKVILYETPNCWAEVEM